VDPDKIEVRRVVIGALPVVNAVLGRLGFEELLGDYLPEPDPPLRDRSDQGDRGARPQPLRLAPAALRALGLGEGLRALTRRARGHSRRPIERRPVGRALDQLFAADRASLLTALSLAVIGRFGVEVKELHNDSTSIVLFGS
jgi:hypothetical protein